MTCVGHGAVRVRLDAPDVQAGLLLRAAGARRFAFNWAVAKIKANADQWHAEASYGIAKPDRVRPLSYFTLGKLWTAERPDVAPWAGEHSTWTFRYALRDAANAHAAFLAGKPYPEPDVRIEQAGGDQRDVDQRQNEHRPAHRPGERP